METKQPLAENNHQKFQQDANSGQHSIVIRPARLDMASLATRLPYFGKVGTTDGMSLLRYRRVPSLVDTKESLK